jgi:hypothetical protein
MRRLAGIGIIMCALAGCQSIPSVIRIEVDGSTLEFKKKVPPAPERAPESNGGTDAPGP